MQTFELSVAQVSALAAIAERADWDQVVYSDGLLIVPDDVAARLLPGEASTLLNALKAEKLKVIANRRWQAENGGFEHAGMTVASDDRAKGLIRDARTKAEADAEHTRRWKAPAGFVTLDAASIISLSDALIDHVAACFEREDALTTAIEAATDEAALEALDIEAGWPGGA